MTLAISVPRKAMPMLSSMARTRSQNASPGVGGNSAPAILPKRSRPLITRAGVDVEAHEAEHDERDQAEQRSRPAAARCSGVRENARG